MRAWYIAIFVAVFGLYLLTSSREPAWGDARPMWDVADRLVQHGAIDIKTRWPDDMPPGRDGKMYGIFASWIGRFAAMAPAASQAQVQQQIALFNQMGKMVESGDVDVKLDNDGLHFETDVKHR